MRCASWVLLHSELFAYDSKAWVCGLTSGIEKVLLLLWLWPTLAGLVLPVPATPWTVFVGARRHLYPAFLNDQWNLASFLWNRIKNVAIVTH